MSEELKDILSHLNPDIDQETLLRYLQGQLSAPQQHEVEKRMMEDAFDSDALDGLQDFTNKKDLTLLVDQLNKDLKQRTVKKKKFRDKLKLRLEPWLLIAVITILVLAILGYLIVRVRIGHR